MKKYLLTLSVILATAACAVAQVPSEIEDVKDDNVQLGIITPAEPVEETEQEIKEREKRLRELNDDVAYAKASNSIQRGYFVLVADNIQIGNTGYRHYDISNNSNFVLVQGDDGIIQFALNTGMPGSNGLGGWTGKGPVRNKRITLKALEFYHPTVCFIDGLLDVVNDFNSNTECQEIVYDCMQCATKYGISLWCLVHQNPGGDKLVGHLGSILERKVTDIFQTKKDKNDTTGLATFTVHQIKARGRDVPDWKFQVLPSTGWGMPEQLNAAPSENDTPENIKAWLTVGRDDIEWPATKEEIKKIFKSRGGVKYNPALLDNIKVAVNRRYIIPQSPDTMKKGQTHPKFLLNPTEFPVKDDLPFEPPTDEQTVLDFE